MCYNYDNGDIAFGVERKGRGRNKSRPSKKYSEPKIGRAIKHHKSKQDSDVLCPIHNTTMKKNKVNGGKQFAWRCWHCYREGRKSSFSEKKIISFKRLEKS